MALFYLFRFIEFILLGIPASWRKRFLLSLSRLAYHIDKKHRLVIEQNLKFIYNDKADDALIERVSRYCYANLLLNFMQAIEHHRHGYTLPEEKVTFENLSALKAVLNQDRPVIYVTAHLGRWELAGAIFNDKVGSITTVYQTIKNPYFDRYMLEARKIIGFDCVEKKGSVKKLVSALRAKRPVSMLIDTNLDERSGVMVDFLGRPTRQTETPAYLARKYNALILPAFLVTTDEEHFTMKVFDAIDVAKSDDAERDILEATQKQADALSSVIREYPQLWFWCHRRWKTDYPEIYRKAS